MRRLNWQSPLKFAPDWFVGRSIPTSSVTSAPLCSFIGWSVRRNPITYFIRAKRSFRGQRSSFELDFDRDRSARRDRWRSREIPGNSCLNNRSCTSKRPPAFPLRAFSSPPSSAACTKPDLQTKRARGVLTKDCNVPPPLWIPRRVWRQFSSKVMRSENFHLLANLFIFRYRVPSRQTFEWHFHRGRVDA